MAAPGDADALTAALFAALTGAGGAARPTAEAQAAALALLDARFPELQHFGAGAAVAASPATASAGADASRAEYYRTAGALFALAACLTAAAEPAHAQAALDLLTAGERGAMSAGAPAGRAVSLAHKPEAFTAFCADLRRVLPTPQDRWVAYVLLACHDVGKSDAFRAAVNATLPPARRSDDHDRALAAALRSDALCAALLPSVAALPAPSRAALAAAAACGFNLPQAAQGEAPPAQLAALLAAVGREATLREGTGLEAFLLHCVFDVAGAACSPSFALPLAIEPVFVGFCRAKDRLLKAVSSGSAAVSGAADVYYDFLWSAVPAAYPAFAPAAAARAESGGPAWRAGTGLVLLRLLALTRNGYARPEALLALLDSGRFAALCSELGGAPPPPQLMLYYGPDALRMGLGTHLASDAPDAAGMAAALEGLEAALALARAAAAEAAGRVGSEASIEVYTLNVAAAVGAIRAAGPAWGGGPALRDLLRRGHVIPGAVAAEGTLAFAG